MLYVGDKSLSIATDKMLEDIDAFIRDFDFYNEVNPFTIKIYEEVGIWVIKKKHLTHIINLF